MNTAAIILILIKLERRHDQTDNSYQKGKSKQTTETMKRALVAVV